MKFRPHDSTTCGQYLLYLCMDRTVNHTYIHMYVCVVVSSEVNMDATDQPVQCHQLFFSHHRYIRISMSAGKYQENCSTGMPKIRLR